MKGYDKSLFERFNEVARREHLLPTKVSEFYKKKVDEEVAAIGIGGPLYKCVYPTEEKLSLFGPGEVEDFVQEYNHYPVEGNTDIVRQYPNRLLFMTTETCVCNCSYCFRTIKLAESGDITKRIKNSLDLLIDYLKENPEVEEVILSGGDPVYVPLDLLREIFTRVRAVGVPHLRLHTRSFVYDPKLLTRDFIALMAEFDVRLVFHVMHPYEICDEVRAKADEIRRANVRMYNQHPLLAGINDDPEVLKRLYTELDEIRVRQMSAFTPDIIAYSASFRIPYKKICEIFDYLNYNSSGWVNAIRLVGAIPPGKARRYNITKWDEEKGIITFEINGVPFEYVDFPEKLYTPSSKEKLLWKDYR